MNNNDKFISISDEINSIAKSYGFNSGIQWAVKAKDNGNITISELRAFKFCNKIRNNLISNIDTKISLESICMIREYLYKIKNSNIRNDN